MENLEKNGNTISVTDELINKLTELVDEQNNKLCETKERVGKLNYYDEGNLKGVDSDSDSDPIPSHSNTIVYRLQQLVGNLKDNTIMVHDINNHLGKNL